MTDYDSGQLDELLSAYLDGEVSQEQSRHIEALLEKSPEARQRLEGLREVSAQLSDLPRRHAPDDLLDNLTDHLEREMLLGDFEENPQVPHRKGSMISLLAAAAMITIVVGGGIWVFSQVGQHTVSTANRTALAPDAAQKLDELKAEAVPQTAMERSVKPKAPPSPSAPVQEFEKNYTDAYKEQSSTYSESSSTREPEDVVRDDPSDLEEAGVLSSMADAEKKAAPLFKAESHREKNQSPKRGAVEKQRAAGSSYRADDGLQYAFDIGQVDRDSQKSFLYCVAPTEDYEKTRIPMPAAVLRADYYDNEGFLIVINRLISEEQPIIPGWDTTLYVNDGLMDVGIWTCNIRIKPEQVDRLIDSLILPRDQFKRMVLRVGFLEANDREKISELLAFSCLEQGNRARRCKDITESISSDDANSADYPIEMNWESFFPDWQLWHKAVTEKTEPVTEGQILLHIQLFVKPKISSVDEDFVGPPEATD